MDKDFISTRLTMLRQNKCESARQMSLALGQNPNYINHVEIGKAHPSMHIFLRICEYLDVTPQDFFDEGNQYPQNLRLLMEDMKQLDEISINAIARLVKELMHRPDQQRDTK